MNGAKVTVPQHPVVIRRDTIQVDGKVIDGGVELTQHLVGLYKSNPADPKRESAWFQPL